VSGPKVLGRCYNAGCVALTTTLLAACQSTPPSAESPAVKEKTPEAHAIAARFDCDTLALTATFHDDRVVIELPERSLTLPHVVSASGARYSDGPVTFWSKGREATLEMDGRKQTCRERRDPWQDALDRGIDFRAVGQEPGWFLEIDKQKQIRLVYDYAEHEFVSPVPRSMHKGKVTFFDVTIESGHVLIAIEDAPCIDAMSGEAFPRSVTITIGDRTLRGCGRDLPGGLP
jgi:putative lipoprotein